MDGWKLYERLKSEQFFSRLKNVRGDKTNGQKVVTKDGVPDGIVFPMLSALGRFVRKVNGQMEDRDTTWISVGNLIPRRLYPRDDYGLI